jgi:hypothetical protein
MTEGEEAMPRQHEVWFLCYIRWTNGRRETMRTKLPGVLAGSDQWVVLACMPEPRVTVHPAVRLKVGR